MFQFADRNMKLFKERGIMERKDPVKLRSGLGEGSKG